MTNDYRMIYPEMTKDQRITMLEEQRAMLVEVNYEWQQFAQRLQQQLDEERKTAAWRDEAQADYIETITDFEAATGRM